MIEITVVTPEIISAIAGLWKLALVVTVAGFVFTFHKQLRTILGRLTTLHFRTGNTEVVVEQTKGATSAPEAGASASSSGVEKSVPPEPPQIPELAEQKPGNLFTTMVGALFDKHFEEATSAYNTLQSGEPNASNRLRNEVIYLSLRYRLSGEGSTLRKLEELSKSPESRSLALPWVAYCYEQSRDFVRASSLYREAIEAADSKEERARLTAALARCYSGLGKLGEAVVLLENALSTSVSNDARITLFESMASLQEQLGNPVLRAAALEKTLEYKPNDTDTRFSAAYALSEASIARLSAINYETLLRFNSDNSAAMNNLAVQLDRLGMPIRAASFYKKAGEKESTLALANLVFRYLNAGLAEEARAVLEIARAQKNPHANVGHAIAALSEREEGESKAWKKAEQSAAIEQQHVRQFAEAWFIREEETIRFDGEWHLPGGERMNVEQADDQISAEWQEGTEKHRLTGTIHNRGAKIKVEKWHPNIFGEGGYFGSAREGYGHISRDTMELAVMFVDDEEPSFLSFAKKK